MKQIFCVLIALLSFSSFAGTTIQNDGASAGAEVIVRQVIGKGLLGQNKNVNADLKRSLEGRGDTNIVNNLTRIDCDGATGSVLCQIGVSGGLNDDQGIKYSYTINTRIHQGDVISAQVGNDMLRKTEVIWEIDHEPKLNEACPAQAIVHDQVAGQVNGNGGYVCFDCGLKNDVLVVTRQTQCNKQITCTAGVCE
jgi:hypothetical protein